MKRFLSILLAAAVLTGSAVFAGIPQAKAEMNEVTILDYICGTDLESDEGEASADIREMLSAGIGGSGAVSAVIATGGCQEWQRFSFSTRSVQYHRLGNSGPELHPSRALPIRCCI